MEATLPGPSARLAERSARRQDAVLLAEDDTAMRSLLAHELRRCGYEVLLAEDGLQLLTQLDLCLKGETDSRLVAVVSDIRMPAANGMRVLEWLRDRACHLPVVLTTAFGTRNLHAEAARLGAILLDKPFDVRELTAVLKLLVDYSPSHCHGTSATTVVVAAVRTREMQIDRSLLMSSQQPPKKSPMPAPSPGKNAPAAPTPAKPKPAAQPGQAPNPKRS